MATPCPGRMMKKGGRTPFGGQRFRCPDWRRTRTDRTGTPFDGHRWPPRVISTAVRWYLRYRLALADVRDLLAERGIEVSARTILRWAHRFGPLIAAAARRAARPIGRRWWADETYVRVGGAGPSHDRAVDEHGQVVDILRREL